MTSSYFPPFQENIIHLEPLTQTKAIQQVGRTGRTAEGISLNLMTKSTFEQLEYAEKHMVTEPMDAFLLKLALSDPRAFARAYVNTLDGLCLQNYMSALDRLVMWHLIAPDRQGITTLGRTFLKMAKSKLTIQELVFLACGRAHTVPAQVMIMTLVLLQNGRPPKTFTHGQNSLQNTIGLAVSYILDPTNHESVPPNILDRYCEMLDGLSAVNYNIYYLANVENTPIIVEAMCRKVQLCVQVAHYQTMYELEHTMTFYRSLNGVQFPLTSIAKHHFVDDLEEETPTKIICVGVGYLNVGGRSVIFPKFVGVLLPADED